LATDLAGFPKDIGDRRTFQFATSTGGNSVSLEFWVTNSLGLTPVDAQIIETEASREFASVRLCIEPAAVDDFVSQLRATAAALTGTVTLRGRAAHL
jgi:hypothetical protein